MALKKKKTSVARYYFIFLLDTLTFDQHMLIFTEFFNGFSLSWYSTLND